MQSRTYDGIETKKHAGIVWRVHDFLIEHQGQFFHTEDLCMEFWNEFNPSLEREMRLIIEEITNDRGIQKIIIGTPNGYIHPRRDQMDLVATYTEAQTSAAKKLFYRVGSIVYRLNRDENMKLKIGAFDSDIFLAFMEAVVNEVEEQQKELPQKQYREAVQPQMVMAEGGQVGWNLCER